jgi:putative colanic acid biosynthesis glycosyltransferase
MSEMGPLLTVVTVVRNDLDGLKATIGSVERIASHLIEHIVIDGSTNDVIKVHLAADPKPYRSWLSEPDQGIYDAMNKGLARAAGRYVTFMNAGDTIAPELDWAMLEPYLTISTKVLQGYVLECFRAQKYLTPGLGQEQYFYKSPRHQGTYYPRAFYEKARYILDRPVGADMDYSYHALKAQGGVFVPTVVAHFFLGGVSSYYGNRKALEKRIKEQLNWRGVAKLRLKYLMWQLLPQGLFYSLLAIGKYTRVGAQLPPLRHEPIVFDGWR